MSLKGLAVIIGYENVVRGEDTDEEINKDIDDGLYDAVTELMGDAKSDLEKAQPYLSAIGPLLSSFGGGPSDADKAKAAEQAKKDEAARKEAEKQEAANKKTTLWVVLGLVGAAVLGFGGYLVVRKK